MTTENSGLRVFENPEFGSVRTVMIDNEPWFVAADVCKALDIDPTSTRRLDDDEKNTLRLTQGIPGNPNVTVVNEPGLYSLVLGSRKPEAKAFKRWITHEVIPSIRKNGMYATPEFLQKSISDPQWAIGVLQSLAEAQNKIKEQEETISIMEPKAEYHDDVLDAEGVLTTTVIAKEYGWSPQKMNKYLHNKGIQYKVGKTWVLYDKYANEGYMETKTFIDDKNVSHVTSYWTQAGRKFIYETLKAEGILPRKPQKKAYFGKPLKGHEEALKNM